MKNCISKKFIINDKILPCTEFEKVYPIEGLSIYEVVRIIDGIPLFFEEHCTRLQQSSNLTNLNINQIQLNIPDKISNLVKVNNQENGNVRIVLNQQRENGKPKNNLILSFIKHHYPSDHDILSGIIAQTVNVERINPNAKTINTKLRSSLDSIIRFRKIYETILVNNNGYITEGSRSNIFFIKSDTLFTTPFSKVLPGITRKKILKICHKTNIKLVEDCIHLANLSSYDAVFISGTSQGISQLKQINKLKFKIGHPLAIYIANQYDSLVKDYIRSLS